MEKVKILIADDFAPVREIWKKILSSDQRIEIVGECSNGAEVLEALHEVRPDVVLLDINMSPINGFEATAYIKEKYPSIKVLGISVHSDPSYVRRLLETGASGFIPKTAKKEEMIQAILRVYQGMRFISDEFQNME